MDEGKWWMPPEERAAHLDHVFNVITGFLRTEIYTTVEIIQELLGYKTRHGTRKALRRLEADGFVKSYRMQSLGMRGVELWGITNQGQIAAWPPGEAPKRLRYFSPKRMAALSSLQHTVDVHRAIVRTLKAGLEWQSPEDNPAGRKRPDGVVTLASGHKAAVEIERTIKTQKRYREIIYDYLTLFRMGLYNSTYYLCPDADFAARLEGLFNNIDSVSTSEGRTIALNPAHRQRFHFLHYNDWPPREE